MNMHSSSVKSWLIATHYVSHFWHSIFLCHALSVYLYLFAFHPVSCAQCSAKRQTNRFDWCRRSSAFELHPQLVTSAARLPSGLVIAFGAHLKAACSPARPSFRSIPFRVQQYARNYRRKSSMSPESCDESCHSCCWRKLSSLIAQVVLRVASHRRQDATKWSLLCSCSCRNFSWSGCQHWSLSLVPPLLQLCPKTCWAQSAQSKLTVGVVNTNENCAHASTWQLLIFQFIRRQSLQPPSLFPPPFSPLYEVLRWLLPLGLMKFWIRPTRELHRHVNARIYAHISLKSCSCTRIQSRRSSKSGRGGWHMCMHCVALCGYLFSGWS